MSGNRRYRRNLNSGFPLPVPPLYRWQEMGCVLIYLEPKKQIIHLIRHSAYLHPKGFKLGFVSAGYPESLSYEDFRQSGIAIIAEMLEYSEKTVLDDAALDETDYDDFRKKLTKRIGARYSDWLLSEQNDLNSIWVSKADRNIEFPKDISAATLLDSLNSELCR